MQEVLPIEWSSAKSLQVITVRLAHTPWPFSWLISNNHSPINQLIGWIGRFSYQMVSYHAFLEKICEPQACGVCLSVSNGQPPTVARDQRNQPSVMAISDSAKWFHFLNFSVWILNFQKLSPIPLVIWIQRLLGQKIRQSSVRVDASRAHFLVRSSYPLYQREKVWTGAKTSNPFKSRQILKILKQTKFALEIFLLKTSSLFGYLSRKRLSKGTLRWLLFNKFLWIFCNSMKNFMP